MVASNSSSVLDQRTRAGVEAKILELELALAGLKKQLNTFTPISSVPSDILRRIFQYVQESAGGERDQRSGRPQWMMEINADSQLSWIKALTHVCSGWRELAIDTPTLWTEVNLLSRVLSSEMLKRSQPAPISLAYIWASSSRIGLPSSWELLEQEMHRIQSLSLELPDAGYDTVISSLRLAGDPTILQACSFSARPPTTYYSYIRGPHSSGSIVELPWKILTNSTSTLQHLHLDRCIFELRTRPVDDIIYLPQLTKLSVAQDNVSTLISCLAHITFPPTCSVSLGFRHSQGEDLALLQLLITISTLWEAKVAVGQVIRTLEFRPGRLEGSVCISFSSEVTEDYLTFNIPSTSTTLLQDILKLAPLEQVQRLVVNFTLTDLLWTFLARSCPDVRSISSGTSSILECLKSIHIGGDQLFPNPGSSPGSTDPSPQEAFRRLEKLELPKARATRWSLVSSRDLLMECIKQRAELEIPIKSLAFPENFVEEDEYLGRLASYVRGAVIRTDPQFGSDFDSSEGYVCRHPVYRRPPLAASVSESSASYRVDTDSGSGSD
ncbi:hypothetical protein BDN72DRAFT_850272 [Pluteus cervinus]|uniref:Uncharacterized protein n=1 Tax=Pluteus cervinus TaxID=181527 RepID=A0ACD3A7C9_9AGAR|nr:hypothetical protein BDN72DRAFT_850272 [Pluteus cervinus]